MPHRRAAGHTQSHWLRLVHVQASKDGQAKPYFAPAFLISPLPFHAGPGSAQYKLRPAPPTRNLMYNSLEREQQHTGHCVQWNSAGKHTPLSFQNIAQNQSVLCHQQKGKHSCGVPQASPTSQTSPSLSCLDTRKAKKSPRGAIRHSLSSQSCCCVEHVPASKGTRQEPRHVPCLLQGFSFGLGRLQPRS